MEKSCKDLLCSKLIETRKKLLGFALILTHSQEQAQDLLQQTSLVILANADNYEERGCFYSWAMEVMKHIFFNELKYRKYRVTLGYDDIPGGASPFSSNEPESEYNCREIVRLITSLPPAHSKAFKLLLDGYSYNEIASKEGCTLGRVKNCLHSARVALRKELGV